METNNKYLSEKEKAIHMLGWTSKRYKGISIAYISLLFAVFPLIEIILLLQNNANNTYDDYTYNIASGNMSQVLFFMVTIVFSTIIAMIAFSYMHNKRCMDLFGSFPISRRTLFFTRYISALLQTFIPMIFVGLIGAMLTLDLYTFGLCMEMLGYLCVGIIGNISFIALLSLCCGTVVDVLVSYLAINGIYPVCIALCTTFPATILPGYDVGSGADNGIFYTLFSPIFAPFAGIWGYDKLLYFIWWIVFSAVLIIGCYIISKRRKTEIAQNTFVFVIVEQAIKLFAGFVVGFGAGWLFAIIGGEADSSYKSQYTWFFVGLFVGVFITEIILHLIYHRGLSRIKMSLMTSIIDVVAVTGFVLVIVTGAFGYDNRIPDVDEVQAVSVNLDTDASYIVDGKDVRENYSTNKQYIKTTVEVQKDIIRKEVKKKKGLYPLMENVEGTSYDEEEDYVASTINISYKLKNGKTIKRVYDGVYMGENVEQLKKYAEEAVNQKRLMQLIPDTDLVEAYCENIQKRYTINLLTGEYVMFNRSDIKKLKDAVIEDYNNVDKDKIRKKDVLYILEFGYDNYKGEYISVNCSITDQFKNTLNVLNDKEFNNMDLTYLQQSSTPSSSVGQFTGKDERTVYFKTPDDWDKNTKIRAMLYNESYDEWLLFDFNSPRTNCEKVKGNIWKYSYSLPEDISEGEFKEYNRIMFYQILDNKVNISGVLKIAKDTDGKCLVLTKKKKTVLSEYYYPMYKYTWENLK